jgi:hypothetical protein
MAEIPRLNGVIRVLEQGKHAFAAFSNAEIDSALAFSVSNYDGTIFELEHNPWDVRALRELSAIHAQQTANCRIGVLCSCSNSLGTNSSERK